MKKEIAAHGEGDEAKNRQVEAKRCGHGATALGALLRGFQNQTCRQESPGLGLQIRQAITRPKTPFNSVQLALSVQQALRGGEIHHQQVALKGRPVGGIGQDARYPQLDRPLLAEAFD